MKPSDPDPFAVFTDSDRTIVRPSPGGPRSRSSVLNDTYTKQPGFPESEYQAVDLAGDNPLTTQAFTLLSLVPKLRNSSYHASVNELRDRLIEELKKYEGSVLSKKVSKKQADIAKYLLCSLVDETILNTPWGSQSGWGHNSLSSLFYKKVDAGREFFEILDRMMGNASSYHHLLELGFICLSLGFEGKYRYTPNGAQVLENKRRKLYSAVAGSRGQAQLQLSDHWQGIRDKRNPLVRHIPLWVLTVVGCVLLMVIYMIFSLGIRDTSDRLYDKLFAMSQKLDAPSPEVVETPLRVSASVSSTVPENRFSELLAQEIARKTVSVVSRQQLRIFNLFRSGSADIRADYQAILAKIAQALQHKNTGISIVGHTDNQRLKFSTHYKSNWHLSMARAESTAKALGQHGIPMDRIRIEGMADKEPIVPNTTKENRSMNRRIDIHLR